MPGPFLLREYELAVQLESAYGTSPGALVGGDFFKHTSSLGVARQIARYDRDRDRDFQQASVITTQKGREKAAVSIECDLIPAGAGTPTAPDIDVLLEAGIGQKHVATAHTTTTSGSTTTVVNFTAGGVAASGTQVGDMIAVDVDGLGNYEVRQVVSIATDNVTVDRALSQAPASGRQVKVGANYRLLNTALKSVHLWRFNGNDLRYKVPGVAIMELGMEANFADDAPVGRFKCSGEGQPHETQATTKPTASTAGIPLVPDVGKVWIAAVRYNVISALFTLNTGYELRNNESAALKPTGMKRTGNNSRYSLQQTIDLLSTDVSKALYDAAATLGQQDVLVQLGNTPGKIVAWRTPKFQPDAEETEQNGEVGYRFAGRCYGTVNDDEITVSFL